MMSLEEYHAEEIRARKQLEKLDPDNPALKRIYSSTYVACEAYWRAIYLCVVKVKKNGGV